MTFRALIAEDEPILAATLAKALQRLWPDLEIVAISPNGVDAVEKALALRPEVLFVDIKMPGKTGLEAIEELSEIWDASVPFPQVVFVTAYDDYAVDAFEHAAADYVMKPVNDARLTKTIERLKKRLGKKSEDDLSQLLGQMRALLPAAPAVERLSVIRAAVGNQVRMIPVSEVVFFEATDKYVNVVTADSEALIRVSLKELLPQLDEKIFWQIHRGTIVNASCVQSSARDEMGKVTLNLRNRPEKLRVGPLYAHLFRQM
ncbi:MAG: LytTR family DNA-binding domain-containing protein [Pseudomonadota bacterium]